MKNRHDLNQSSKSSRVDSSRLCFFESTWKNEVDSKLTRKNEYDTSRLGSTSCSGLIYRDFYNIEKKSCLIFFKLVLYSNIVNSW